MPKKRPKNHRRKIVIWIVLIVFLIFVFESFLLMLRYNRINKYKSETVGVSFSQTQAERYGTDWRANYIGLLDEIKFKYIRLPAYWDRIEKSPGEFDFSETDWMIEEANKRGVEVTLIVGQKNIRYPECYYPSWVNPKDTASTSQQAITMVQRVVDHYKNNPAIKTWQLENEFLLKSFGDCPKELLTNQQLQKELVALKEIDNTRPVIFTQSDQFGFPVKGPFGNIFAFSMYRWSWNKGVGYWRYPQTGEYFWWKAALISLVHKQEVKVHELQAEAWGPVGNEHMEYNDTLKTMNPEQFRDNIKYARDTRIRNYDLWGAEWWWHLKQQGHPDMWEEVKSFVSETK